jgi:hypothetical protein
VAGKLESLSCDSLSDSLFYRSGSIHSTATKHNKFPVLYSGYIDSACFTTAAKVMQTNFLDKKNGERDYILQISAIFGAASRKADN